MNERYARNSSLDELYGPNRFNEPTPPGKIDWKPIIIHATITAAVIIIPVVTIVVIQNRRHARKMESMNNDFEEKLERLYAYQQIAKGFTDGDIIS